MNAFKNIGPATLVTAAFIGPGTVTLCTIAGVGFGHSLLWALLFSVFATISLQEMSARIGLITGKGLAEVITQNSMKPYIRYLSVSLILTAIIAGNLAYEAGNISGAGIGLQLFVKPENLESDAGTFKWINLLIGFIAFIILYFGNYKTLEKVLVFSVLIMSLSFVLTAFIVSPSITSIIQGLFIPSIDSQNILTVIALIGTTVVPYNLFLHASLVSKKWDSSNQLQHVRRDTYISIGVGGIISMSIIVCAASMQGREIGNLNDLAVGLEPLFGTAAKYILALGMMAAGLSSSITAPLAAAFVAKECLNWSEDTKSFKFRCVWIIILIAGVLFSTLGIQPIHVIKFAQVINGILLPVSTAFVLWIINKKSIMHEFINSRIQNMIALIVFGITLFLGVKSIYAVL
ncbi:MAG: Nramp family divalent metal transporter [Cyclobacteriaceae bacterium]